MSVPRLAACFALALLAIALPAPIQRGAAPAEVVSAIQELIGKPDLDAANMRLEEALRRYPADGGLYNLKGVVAAQRNDYAGAEAAFRKAVRLAPQLTGAWLNLGRLYQMNLDRDPAAVKKGTEVYRHILAAAPDLPEANHQIAVLLQAQSAFRESLAHLDRLPPEDRARTSALALRCAAQAGSGDPQAAATAMELLRHPDLAEGDVLSILPALGKANADGIARILLEGLAERKIASAGSLSMLAAAYERGGDLSRARATYEAAAQTSPALVDSLLDLARVAWKQKDYEGALGYLAHARDLEPDRAGVHFFFGLACNELRLAVEAKKSLEKALELAPDNPYYSYAMGAVLMQWSDAQQAIPHLRKYLAAKPADPRGRLALATAYFLAGQPDQAKLEATAIRDDPAVKAAAYYLLGRIARDEGNPEEAAVHLRAALRAADMPEARAELGLVLLQKEDLAGAERETMLALKREPGNFLANRTLMQLYARRKDPRAKEQAERLKTLVEDRNRQTELMLRTIEVRPY